MDHGQADVTVTASCLPANHLRVCIFSATIATRASRPRTCPCRARLSFRTPSHWSLPLSTTSISSYEMSFEHMQLGQYSRSALLCPTCRRTLRLLQSTACASSVPQTADADCPVGVPCSLCSISLPSLMCASCLIHHHATPGSKAQVPRLASPGSPSLSPAAASESSRNISPVPCYYCVNPPHYSTNSRLSPALPSCCILSFDTGNP